MIDGLHEEPQISQSIIPRPKKGNPRFDLRKILLVQNSLIRREEYGELHLGQFQQFSVFRPFLPALSDRAGGILLFALSLCRRSRTVLP